MSVSMDSSSNTVKIYIRLLNEATDVSRPTQALDLGGGLFNILPTSDYELEDETWEFVPGSTVRAELCNSNSGEYLLAVAAN